MASTVDVVTSRSVYLPEIAEVRGKLGLLVERDLCCAASYPVTIHDGAWGSYLLPPPDAVFNNNA